MIQPNLPGDERPGPDAPFDSDSPVHPPPQGPARDDLGFGAGLDGPTGGATKKRPARKKPTGRKTRAEPRGKASGKAGPGAAKSTAKSTAKRSAAAASGDEGGDQTPAARRAKKSERERPAKRQAKRSRLEPAAAEAATPALRADGEGADGEGAGEQKKRRRRGSRGGRRRKKKSAGVAVEALPGEEDDIPALPEESQQVGQAEGAATQAKKKRKRKRSRRVKASAESAQESRSRRAGAAKKTKTKRSKKASTRASTRAAAEAAPATEQADQIILVNAIDKEEKRVAVVEKDRIVEFLMTSESHKTLVNDIYRGRVVNLEPAIGAAFVDFGQGRNGFLHTSDVLAAYGEKDFTLVKLLTSKVDPEDWDEESGQPGVTEEVGGEEAAKKEGAKRKGGRRTGRRRARERRPISELLRVSDQVVVQVTKDAIGDKGPTLTTYISIPGRYLVLMPSMARTGVSRKIPDDKERRRLKRILESLKAPEDMGVIVRTAGVGKTKTDLQRDLDYLMGVWENFGKRLDKGRGPVPLYQESDVATRTLRDLFNSRTAEVVVDDPVVHGELVEFAQKLMPEHVDRIHRHEGDRPVFHHYGVEQDFEKIFARRVELPSGGSIVFDQAEALVAIDVNSGRTRTNSFDFEEIALKTNLEAVPEIARQIRLRDLGGILVCDFIDMIRASSNRSVERALRAALAGDRARSKLGRISQFGLLELTRQRLGPGTHKKVFQTCPRCRGTARIRTVESRAQAIVRRLGSALTQKGFSTVEVRAHPEVVDYLREDMWDYLRALEHRFEKELKLSAVPDQPEDSVLRYLRADGREVRPGGRRKR